jgi:O-antigen/teichoic acid export membrane protein
MAEVAISGGPATVDTEAPSSASIARAGGLNLVARMTSGAATLGLAILSTNLLDTHGRGIYAILSTWAGIVLVIVTGGTTILAADLIHGRHDDQVMHGAAVAIAVEASALLFPVAAIAALFTNDASLAALLFTAAVTVLMTYLNFETAIVQARGNVVRVSLIDIGSTLFPLLATVAVAIFFDATVTSLMAAWAFGVLLTVLAQFASALTSGGIVFRRVGRVAASITRRSLGVSIANGTALLCSRIDVLVVAAVMSASDAGIYSIPVALATALLLLSRSLLTATYHPIMTAPASAVASRLSLALRHSVIVMSVGGALSVPVVAATAGFVFGDAYSAIWEPYALLVPAAVCICVAEILRHFLITRMERQREIVFTATAMLIVNGGLAVVGAAEFGLIGAAASTTVTYAAAAIGLVWFCARELGVPAWQLAIPRRSDLAPYWRMAQVTLARWRSTESVGGP